MNTIINDPTTIRSKMLLNVGYDDDLPVDDLNPQQRAAVNCKSKIIYVNAGPGTGKTHLLTSKIIEYIQTSSTPQRVVALSYTNTAANHIGEKFKEKAKDAGLTKEYTFYYGTLHSFCYSLLRAYKSTVDAGAEDIILDEEEIRELAEEICIQLNKQYPVKEIERCLQAKKGMLPALQKIVDEYKQRYKVISVQDILANFIKAMDEDALFREWIKPQITAMAIDEAQDLSEENYIILDKLLTAIPKLHVFLVGDPRQNIFEFNGGSYRHLEDFLGRHEQHATKHLTLTYRCGQNIADFVNRFQFTDCENTQLKSMCDEAGKITVKSFSSEAQEAFSVVKEIKDKGLWSDIAILCNNLAYMTPIMREMRSKGIPYKVLGGRRILKTHIRLLKHLLRIVDSENEYSIRMVAATGLIDLHPPQGVKKTAKEMFYESYLGNRILTIREMYNRTNPGLYALMMELITQLMRIPEDGGEIADDLDRILILSQQYESVSEFLLAFVTDKDSFAEFYQKDYLESTAPITDSYVTLSTIHSAKGLEWRYVFLVGLSEGNFPNSYFCQGMTREQQIEYYNGELKKMYVASTRAKEQLYLTYSTILTRKGYTFTKKPSRFITENKPVQQ